jgi:hypothetical protein
MLVLRFSRVKKVRRNERASSSLVMNPLAVRHAARPEYRQGRQTRVEVKYVYSCLLSTSLVCTAAFGSRIRPLVTAEESGR